MSHRLKARFPAEAFTAALASALSMMLLGCSSGPILFKENRYPPLALQARLASLEIKDARQGHRELDIPFLTGLGRTGFVKPISTADSFAIGEQVRRNLTGDGVAMHLQVTVEEAVVGWENNFIRELEVGRFKVRIGFWHGQGKIAECTGKASLERRTINTTEEHLRQIFEEGLILALYQCLESTKEELQKSPGSAPGASPI